MSIFESTEKTIEELQQALTGEALVDKNLKKFGRSFSYIQSQIKNADALICSASVPQEISNALGATQQELNAYVSNRNEVHFNNAENNALNAVKISTAIPQIQVQTKGEYFSAALNP